MSASLGPHGAFFARMTGICFSILTLGYAKCGVSKDAWIKQTMLFHVGTIPVFFLNCASTDGADFTPWVWYRALRRCGGCLHFPRHRRDAIDATRHHVSARSPNRHQHCVGRLGLHGDDQEQDEVGSSMCRRGTHGGEFNPAAPPPSPLFDS